MPEKKPPAKKPAEQPRSQPLVSRSVITIVTLVLVGAMVFATYQRDYRSMIVLALVVLFILGADLGSLIRGWRGGGQ